MWRLVKGELSYVRIILLIVGVVFVIRGIGIILAMISYGVFTAQWNIYFHINPYEELRLLSGLKGLVYLVIIVNLIMVYLEVMEHRVAQRILLPLPVWKIELVQITIPLTLLIIPPALYLIFLCLKFLFLSLPLVNYPNILGPIISEELDRLTWSGGIYTFNSLMATFGVGLIVSYAARLWTELYGRILLVVMVAGLLFHGLVLPLINQPFAWRTGQSLVSLFAEPDWWFVHEFLFSPYIWLTLFFWAVMIVSFMRRRSYLS